jgi:hypothetical protein
MSVALFGMRLLEWMFFVGIAGSAIVIFFASLGDIRELSRKSEEAPAAEKTA